MKDLNNIEWDDVTFSAEDGVVKMSVKPINGEIDVSIGLKCYDKMDIDSLIDILKVMRKTLPD